MGPFCCNDTTEKEDEQMDLSELVDEAKCAVLTVYIVMKCASIIDNITTYYIILLQR